MSSTGDMRLVVTGATGRMGRSLVRTVAETPGTVLVGALARPGNPAMGADAGVLAGVRKLGVPISDDALASIANADGVIDFTSPESSIYFSELSAQARVVHVIGTTGFSEEQELSIAAASRHAVTIKSANMSIGANIIQVLAEYVAGMLDERFDIEILDIHHRDKVDAPSGTALMLGRATARGRKVDFTEHAVFGRGADRLQRSARKKGEIGFASQRQGSVICDHTVSFAGHSERIILRHVADNRQLFAEGAIKAALWGRNRVPGLYSLADVLDLKGKYPIDMQ